MSENLAWITGAGGLIGSHLLRLGPELAPGWEIVGLTRARLDLTQFDAVRRLFLEQCPRLLIHCAALSRSPACQADPALARRLNLDVTRFLAELAAEIPFVFFSSDLVFDGSRGNYVESDSPNPLSVYAETKLAAERIVLANPRHTVVRTSLNGGASPTGDRGFNEELRLAWRAGRKLTLFTDEFRCPLPAAVTARAVWELAAKHQPGLYHLAGAERLSRWQIGQLVAARWPHLHPQLEPGSIKNYAGPPRPGDTSLACATIAGLLSFPLPGLSHWLAQHPDVVF
ncbi:MAG: SDR family oxidoreductase [Verrucomicrobia bacterium]|nr:SDR family oxidoreductase [Verrucomicrobiota bacterium]